MEGKKDAKESTSADAKKDSKSVDSSYNMTLPPWVQLRKRLEFAKRYGKALTSLLDFADIFGDARKDMTVRFEVPADTAVDSSGLCQLDIFTDCEQRRERKQAWKGLSFNLLWEGPLGESKSGDSKVADAESAAGDAKADEDDGFAVVSTKRGRNQARRAERKAAPPSVQRTPIDRHGRFRVPPGHKFAVEIVGEGGRSDAFRVRAHIILTSPPLFARLSTREAWAQLLRDQSIADQEALQRLVKQRRSENCECLLVHDAYPNALPHMFAQADIARVGGMRNFTPFQKERLIKELSVHLPPVGVCKLVIGYAQRSAPADPLFRKLMKNHTALRYRGFMARNCYTNELDNVLLADPRSYGYLDLRKDGTARLTGPGTECHALISRQAPQSYVLEGDATLVAGSSARYRILRLRFLLVDDYSNRDPVSEMPDRHMPSNQYYTCEFKISGNDATHLEAAEHQWSSGMGHEHRDWLPRKLQRCPFELVGPHSPPAEPEFAFEAPLRFGPSPADLVAWVPPCYNRHVAVDFSRDPYERTPADNGVARTSKLNWAVQHAATLAVPGSLTAPPPSAQKVPGAGAYTAAKQAAAAPKAAAKGKASAKSAAPAPAKAAAAQTEQPSGQLEWIAEAVTAWRDPSMDWNGKGERPW